jgi:hypothetical protein
MLSGRNELQGGCEEIFPRQPLSMMLYGLYDILSMLNETI